MSGAPSPRTRATLAWGGLCLGLSAAAFWWMKREEAFLLEKTFVFQGRELSLAQPQLVWLVALVPLLLFGVFRSFADLPWQQRIGSFLLRSAFFVCLVLGLSRPQQEEESSKICTVVMVDVSTSVADEALEDFRKILSEIASKKAKDDSLRLLGFGEHAGEIVLTTTEKGHMEIPTVEQLRRSDAGGATNIEGALRLAAAHTESNCVGRYVLFTDGIETRGNALSAVAEARGRGVRVDTHLLSKSPPADAAVVSVEIPSAVRTGEPFEVRVQLRSTKPIKGQLRLYQGATINGLGGARQVALPAGAHYETFESVVRVPGDVLYRAEFAPESADQFPENNQFVTSVEVPGPPRVLLIDRKPSQATYLAQALVSQQLDVDVREPAATPQSLAELGPFQFVILSDLARADVSRGAEALFEQYVRGGGGLLYAGGEAAYGPGGWQGSRLEQILPVTMESHKEREVPGVAMALVIDRSGSMTGLPIEMAKEACNATLGVLDGSDLIEVIAFDSQPKRFVPMQPARYQARIQRQVSTILPGGGTEIFNSLDMAYQDLAATRARKKHIILLTDGNAGNDGLYELSAAAFAEGITITTVGLGGGVNSALLTMIAEGGGGRFHVAEDPSRLPRIFTRETELISKKAAVDDWFPVSAARGATFLNGVGIGAAPLLRGYTSTQLGPAPSELVLISDRGEPILARRPIGLGWTLAWTSDLKARWATDWLKWGTFGRFMAQLVREHQKTDDTEVRPLEVRVVGDEVVATLEAYDQSENFDNQLRSTLSVRHMVEDSPEGGAKKSAPSTKPGAPGPEPTDALISFRSVAPGLYQARAPLEKFGSYSIKAVHKRLQTDGSLVSAGVSFASVTRPYPEEFSDLTARPQVLKEWARMGGGTAGEAPADVWKAKGDKVITRVGRQNDFIILAVILFLLDLLLRRVRIFDRNFRARG